MSGKKKDIKGVKKNALLEEESAPDSFGIRQPWDSSEITSILDPGGLAELVLAAKNGDARSYLTLAEEMEERDLHYRSVIGTRKHAIESLEPVIEPSGDDSKSLAIAEDITDTILRKPYFDLLIKDALDGLGKGYSVNEIIWETGADKWRPVRYEWRDPRWFEYDRETGKKLLLKDGTGNRPLSPYKYIIHEPHLKSGLPIRGGLALPVAFYYLVKYYDITGWSAFCQVYGYPIRLGKYDGRNASAKDKEVLRSAVRNLGRDVGAIIPKSMEIAIVNGVSGTGNVTLYEKMANWVDKQISKGVLGQTMSTDAEGGQYKGDLHNEVRQEIRESDANQLAATLTRDLIKPYVDLNYGIQEHYPILQIPVPKPQNIPALVDAVEKLVPLGFKVKVDELYRKLGLTRPDKGDDTLTPPPAVQEQPVKLNTELNRQTEKPADDLEDIIALQENDWLAISDPVKAALNDAVNECSTFEEMLGKIPSLIGKLGTENSATRIALGTFLGRALGNTEFEEK